MTRSTFSTLHFFCYILRSRLHFVSICHMFAEMLQRRWYAYSLCFHLLLLSLPFPVLSSDSLATNPHYKACSKYSSCGNKEKFNVTYPFRLPQTPTYCGYPGYELICSGDNNLAIRFGAKEYTVTYIDYNLRFLIVLSSDFMEKSCPLSFSNTSIVSTNFEYGELVSNLTVYLNCSFTMPPKLPVITCLAKDFINPSYYNLENGPSNFLENLPGECGLTAAMPVYPPSVQNDSDLFEAALKEGFGLTWNYDSEWCQGCIVSGGICGYNLTLPREHTCFCPNTTSLGTCNSSAHKRNKGLIIGLTGLTVALVCFLLVSISLYFWICPRHRLNTLIFSKKSKISQTIEAFLDTLDYLGPKRYNYSALKKITKSFSEKLGQGGYGSVFRGQLPDGRPVAVKILTDTTGNGDEFVNEVASIGRTSHVNVVHLLGFSSEGSKRALIYEFMSNGSLEKYIYSENLKSTLGWEKLYQIAVGIARGLEYLHRGCTTRIVHFDIKPHNILLDQDFCPKISDFGLAKLCLRKDSIFSAIDTRGTIGYIAPEVFSRNFGVVSSKSDVYSYGMMVLEMVGGRNSPPPPGDDSGSDQYFFPHWIYQHFHEVGRMVGLDVTAQTEEIAKKMILVGLWCIQTPPGIRPAMRKVVDMLENSVDDIEMPPKPYLSTSPN